MLVKVSTQMKHMNKRISVFTASLFIISFFRSFPVPGQGSHPKPRLMTEGVGGRLG